MNSFLKIFLFGSALFVVGLPLSLLEIVFLMVVGLWLYGLKMPISPQKTTFIIASFCLLKALTTFIPHPHIEEGHNVIHPVPQQWTRQSAIPEVVRTFILSEFEKTYPTSKGCSKETYGCWRFFTSPPQDFSSSSEGIFHPRIYSRRVPTIHHTSLAEARIGEINKMNYNFYDRLSDIKRLAMPYYVFYDIPKDFAGSALELKGSFFFERKGTLTRQFYDDSTTLIIPSEGMRVYGIHIAPDSFLKMTLNRSLNHIAWDFGRVCLLILIPLFLFWRALGLPSWEKIKIPLLSVGSFFLACLILRPTLFTTYPILDGGGDGLVYEGYGREILEALSRGDIMDALRGGESIYYFMPGLRYLKALEKILVGESFLGLVCLASLMGFFIYQTLRHFLSQKAAWWGFILFCFFPIFERFGFAGYLYAQKIFSGHGEPIAILMFFMGTHFMMKGHKKSPGKPLVLLSALAFSLSAFIRPSYLVPIGFFTGVYWVQDLLKAKSFKASLRATVPYCGYATLLIMPLHNFVFGDSLTLTTSAALHPVNLHVTLTDYGAFFRDLITCQTDSLAVQKVLKHLDDWNGLSDSYRFLPLFYVLIHAFKKTTPIAVRAISLSALSSHILLLFYIAVGRYAYLAWMLTLIVFFYEFETKLYPKRLHPLIYPFNLKMRRILSWMGIPSLRKKDAKQNKAA